jgi:hypothetical protein
MEVLHITSAPRPAAIALIILCFRLAVTLQLCFHQAVGATFLLSSSPVNETSASFSSGGFSNYWPRPDYQKQAVDDYFNKSKPKQSTVAMQCIELQP